MRRVIKFVFLSAVMACAWAPTEAYADGYVSPFAGVNFTTSTGVNKRSDYGVNAGWMGAGIAGFEVDFGYAPSYFGDHVGLRGDIRYFRDVHRTPLRTA